MERLGGYITQGVSTVAGPFHSFGGAVDVIVVEQEDGSFRSTPWYVKFGKVLGVIKRTEKTVAVAVNGVEANFHMHLDSSGHAYFLNEVESPEGEDARKNIVPGDDGCNGTNEVEGHYHDPYSQVSPVGGFVISKERKLAKKRLRQLKSIVGLVFRRKSQRLSDSRHVSSILKSRQKTSDRLALIEMAELAAELLERKWCTGYPKGIQCKQQNPRDDASLGDSKISPQVQSIEAETDNSEVVLVTVDGHLIKAPVSPLDSGKRETDEYSSLNTDQSRISRTTITENTPLKDITHGFNLGVVRSKMSKLEVSSKCVKEELESVVTRYSSGPVSGNYSFNTESTSATGKRIPHCLSLPLEGKGAAAVRDFDCEDVTIQEFKSAGIAESVGALSAQHLDATESNRQSGREKLRTSIPTSEQLSSLHLKGGQNIITFTFFSSVFGKQQVDARIYLWKWNSRVVVSDVDGTITKSDVLGHVMPFVGKDWSHLGVARLFSAIKDNGYEFLFLSARAISQAYVTRQLLLNLKQEGETLPDGPVVISPDGLFPSLYREVIRRAPHEFKIACLEDIKALFPSTGNPFYAGFGNRDTDELSYLKVGVPKGKIFTINPKGEVVVNRLVDAKSYTSLHKLVNDMFPSMPSSEHEDFNSWNYWRVPLPGVED